MIMLPAGLWIMSNLKLKVHIVGTNGLPANYGGFETLTENLCRELNKDCDFTVYCSANGQEIKKDYHFGAKLVHIPLQANGWQSIPYDCISLLMAVFRSDVILMLGSSGGFVMPFIRGGELYKIYQDKKRFEEPAVIFYAAQMILAVDDLHQKGYAHRDLKLENIMVDETGYLKIIDYGLAKMLKDNQEAQSYCGTPEYLAPEMVS